ncbi:MAG TPA: bacterial transcriptional activator domain-containing protein [Acidimicrobiales bacterium]|nr:bacterial transcriptional activator domain-containing protein [Acidimicrobiales bacterium]
MTIGHDGGGMLMVDLEQAASLDIRGANDEGIMTMIAVEMATAKWADQVDVLLVGFDSELESLDRVSQVASIADIVSRVRRRVRERTALLTSVDRRANWEIRWTEGGDAWDLLVVMCARRAVAEDPIGASELVELAGNGGVGLAVILGSDDQIARWHVDARDGRVELTSDRSMVSAARPEVDETRISTGIASLVRVAGDLNGVAPTEPPYDKLLDDGSAGALVVGDGQSDDFAAELGQLDRAASPGQHENHDVEVRVLGPVEIVGASRPFTRAWAVELVVFLAMHPKGASSEQWATALWPNKVMAAASLHSTASAARRSLGVSSTGGDHLPRAHGRLSLAETVHSDWSRFVALSKEEGPESWRYALELIRGRPFEGLRAPDWVLLEGISANIEAVVVDLASRYAEHSLAAGDPSEAEWSARQGLRVSAYDERLYRVLLLAADSAGNPAGVESVMAELVHLVAEDVEPFDAVHPETLDLYRTLSRRRSSIA